jgi:predicted enzyme related to lactoylglutathione lyase
MAPSQLTYWSLPVKDPQRAQQFFGTLFGWTFSDPGSKGGVHVMESEPWGGLAPSERDFATLAFGVEDIGAAVARVRELGGTATDPADPNGYGPWSDCTDDQGNPFGLFVRNPDAS